jgi:adenylate cyclase
MVTTSDILRGKILIVDDQPANVLLLEQMLRGAGYTSVSSTTDPTRVCELHLTNSYALILLDLHMPVMDGFQVMENLKDLERGAWLPVLVITAQPDHKLRALQAGARDFVSKPFDLAEVLLRVHNMLEVRLLHEETRRLYDRVVIEQKTAERLLQGFLPAALLDALHVHPAPIPESESEIVASTTADVTLLFADLLSFVTFAEGTSATVLRAVLGQISDRLQADPAPGRVDRAAVLGDAYLAAAGLPGSVVDRSVLASRMALDLMEAIDRWNAHSACRFVVAIGIEGARLKRGTTQRRRGTYRI